jgi:hypothetical protein
MTLAASHSPLKFLIVAAGRQVVRRPYVPVSLAAHALLLAWLYYFGSYETELRQQQASVASSLRATDRAVAARQLRDLETIKQLLEKSAGQIDGGPERDSLPDVPPQTPEQMVQRARELSEEIHALDEQIKAKELAELTGEPVPPPRETQTEETKASDTQVTPRAVVTPEEAASEVAALEANARATLAKRQQRLEAREDGVSVGPPTGPPRPGSGEQAARGDFSLPPGLSQNPGNSARGEIAEFIGGAGGRSEEMKRSATYANLDFYRDGSLKIPAVDASTLVRGQGRMLGAGGEYANRVYLDTWYIIGPFAGRHGAGLFDNPSYPPEKAVLLDAVYYGKGQRVLEWRYFTAHRYPLVPPDSAEDSVYYGYTEVFVDEACDLLAWIGADDDVQIWMNDRMVWEGGNVNKRPYFDAVFVTRNTYLRDYNRTEGQRVLHFKQGRNRLFFKLSNGPNHPYLSMVLTR